MGTDEAEQLITQHYTQHVSHAVPLNPEFVGTSGDTILPLLVQASAHEFLAELVDLKRTLACHLMDYGRCKLPSPLTSIEVFGNLPAEVSQLKRTGAGDYWSREPLEIFLISARASSMALARSISFPSTLPVQRAEAQMVPPSANTTVTISGVSSHSAMQVPPFVSSRGASCSSSDTTTCCGVENLTTFGCGLRRYASPHCPLTCYLDRS